MKTPNRRPDVAPPASATSQTSLISMHEQYEITSFMSCADYGGIYISPFLFCVQKQLASYQKGKKCLRHTAGMQTSCLHKQVFAPVLFQNNYFY